MRRLLLSFVLVAAIPAVAAHGGAHADTKAVSQHRDPSRYLDEPSRAKELWNGNADRVPGAIRSLVSGERVNLHIETDEGERVYGIVMDGAEIAAINETALDDPTLEVFVSLETIRSIASAERPSQRAVQALNSGDIRYETKGFLRGLLFGAVSLGARILALF